MKIFGTITLQEVIVLCLTAMLFVGQPFGNLSQIAFISLAVAGVLVFHNDKSIARSIGIKQIGIVVLLLGLPGVFSLLSTVNSGETTKFAGFLPVFFFAGVTIFSLCMNYKLLDVLVTIIAITSVVWVLDSIVQYFTGNDLLGNPMVATVRVSGPFSNTHLGMLLTVTLPITLKWLARFGWTCQIVYILVLAFTLFFTGVRTDILTFILSIFVFYVFYIRTTCGRLIFISCFVPMLVFVGWVGITNSAIAKARFETTTAIFQQGDFRNNLNRALSGRIEIWEASWSMFNEEPITGIGANSFQEAYQSHKPDSEMGNEVLLVNDAYHVHHVWIGILAETGMVGFFGLVGAIAFLVFLTCKSRGGFNLYTYPWMLSFLLIINPFNTMPPLFKLWWVPIVLLVIVVHLVELHRGDRTVLQRAEH